jgi:hypothetical protein
MRPWTVADRQGLKVIVGEIGKLAALGRLLKVQSLRGRRLGMSRIPPRAYAIHELLMLHVFDIAGEVGWRGDLRAAHRGSGDPDFQRVDRFERRSVLSARWTAPARCLEAPV